MALVRSSFSLAQSALLLLAALLALLALGVASAPLPNAGFYPGYNVLSMTTTPTGLSGTLVLPSGSAGPYGNDSKTLTILVEFQTQQRIHVKITDAAVSRWEVPGVLLSEPEELNDSEVAANGDDRTLRHGKFAHSHREHASSSSAAKPKPFRYKDHLDSHTDPATKDKHRAESRKLHRVSDNVEELTAQSNGNDYLFAYTLAPFGFAIIRSSTGDVLFNSTPSVTQQDFNGLIFEDMYLELSTRLPNNPNIYGLGERVHQFRLDPNGKTYTIFNRDQGTPFDDGNLPGKNLYGQHPFYMEHRNGLSHGVFLLNSNAMDVVINNNKLTYKVIGGVLDFYFFTGPEPESVLQQYHSLIGYPVMIPYWSLGFHQCRWGYTNVSEVETVVQQYRANNLPLDTMWNDIDHMDKYFDFTLDPVNYPTTQMQQFLKNLSSNNQHYIMIVDAGIPIQTGYAPYDNGIKGNVFIQDPDQNLPALGKVWPGSVHFPDFLNPNTSNWWVSNLNAFYTNSIPFSGVWLDMNEVSNFCDGDCDRTTNPKINPPYMPGQTNIQVKTLSMDARHYTTTQFNAHSLFGFLETKSTNAFLTQTLSRRPVIISRSSFPGHGRYGGHWLGDNTSTWDDLIYSISGIFDFQLFGIPFVGADICGFNGETTEELCTRWMQLGTLYPFSRNHNTIGARAQEPYAFGPTLLNASRIALNLRYSLLPYYYTLFHRVSTTGGSVFRPLLFEWPSDVTLIYIDHQFLIGSALLVSPVVFQSATSVSAYFPADVWYDFYSGSALGSNKYGQWITVDAPIDKIPMHIRGGHVIPMQAPNGALTTADTLRQPYQLLAALNQTGFATGYLYWDDGEGVNTEAKQLYTVLQFLAEPYGAGTQFSSTLATPLYAPISSHTFSQLTVYGVAQASHVTVNGASYSTFSYNSASKVLTITGLSLSLGTPFTISWQ